MFVAFLGFANISMAQDGSFVKNHPRRAEVNQRLQNQDRRIHNKVRNGDISRHQAHNLHRKDHRIRREEEGWRSATMVISAVRTEQAEPPGKSSEPENTQSIKA